MRLRLVLPDVWLSLVFIALCAIGWMTVYSASDGNFGMMTRHSVHLLLAVACVLLVANIDSKYLVALSLPLYVLVCAFLVLLLLDDSSGVRRWFRFDYFSIQPSELMKPVLPMVLAWCLSLRHGQITWWNIVFALLLTALPVWLIARQPDLGTAVVIAAVGCAALWIGGLPRRALFIMGATALLLSPLLWSTLHEYQRNRILYFLFPESDPLGQGYHVIQSAIAIGSGGVHGKGWLHGTQSHLDFLPERTTDFVFSVFCEEFGFIGVLFMLALFISLCYRGFMIAFNSPGMYGRILAASICFMITICAGINMGMVSGQLPVVGLPLPFISMGGSALIATSLAIGMLCSIHNSSRKEQS